MLKSIFRGFESKKFKMALAAILAQVSVGLKTGLDADKMAMSIAAIVVSYILGQSCIDNQIAKNAKKKK